MQNKKATRRTVAEKRKYVVVDVKQAKSIAEAWLKQMQLDGATRFGLPEVDDRYHIWRIPILQKKSDARIGECVIDAKNSLVVTERSTGQDILKGRLLGQRATSGRSTRTKLRSQHPALISSLRNTIALGDCEDVLVDLPAESVDLVFTSPPYYNARPEYNDFISYHEYLLKMRKVIHNAHRVLGEGRFFVINVSPVLVRRVSRSHSSKRIAVPFDFHQIFIEEGFDFIDDILWVKPEGAGWATGRGRRFAADRNPLQYKAVPITEYVLVYRKRSERLIDWHIRNHRDAKLVRQSRIPDDYERTNVWKIKPAHNKIHPAVFPAELAERVIRYYSFVDDTVLDPFAGIGTVGAAATKLGRRFVLIEQNEAYVANIRKQALKWLGKAAANVLCMNCAPIDTTEQLF